MGRSFNRSQRAALYLAADGHCSVCGSELAPGWHADHRAPWVHGGSTDVVNGQALCPRCNTSKGARMPLELRDWQKNARQEFFTTTPRDFTVSATPGAGKTTFALSLAEQLLMTDRTVERIVVVVPTDALRQQWANEAAKFGLHLKPVNDPVDYDKPGYHGCVATYQQLAASAGASLMRRVTGRPTVAILDEIHHAGDTRSWGEALQEAVGEAKHRIALTGTPWRRDKTQPIPFVTYDDTGTVHVDHAYEYGTAVVDGVCRQVEFHAYDGTAKWVDCGKVSEAELGTDLPEEDIPAVLDSVLDPNQEWIPALLRNANDALDELREETPDAGGLVVAQSQYHARAYADILQMMTGEAPTVAISDEPESKAAIDKFRNARSKWLVAVKMVSEGVDIPRLAAGVYASKTRTPLFFRQVVGRFVRTRPDEEINARLYIPAVPALMRHAKEVEDELRHELQAAVERAQREQPNLDGASQGRFDLHEPLAASVAEFDSVIFRGDQSEAEVFTNAEALAERHGIPKVYAANLLRAVQDAPAAAAAASPLVPETSTPRHQSEDLLRGEIKKLSGKIAYRSGRESKDVNGRLYQEFGPRKKLTVEELVEQRDFCAKWLDQVSHEQ